MSDIRKLEDTFVDDLYGEAPRHGAALLAARFSRMYVDPNRSESDFDPTMLAGVWQGPALSPGPKGLMGRGVVFLVCPPAQRIYDRELTAAEVLNRIVTYHRPYHEHLRGLLDRTHARFGRAFHINCHCMAPVPNTASGEPFKDRRPDIILGNMDGQSCGPDLMEVTRDFFAGKGLDTRVNEWFKGVEVARRYGDPAKRFHTLQIEINRDLYAVEETLQPSATYDSFKATLTELIACLADFAKANDG